MDRQVLFLDADDTLWENNIYFERAIERFYGLLGRAGDERAAARAVINRQERRVIEEIGYGLESFRVALERAYGELAPGAWNETAAAGVAELAEAIASEPIEFLPGALEVLRYLAPRHRLMLMTKGDYAEQTRKIERAGIAPLFERIHVLAEKNVGVYQERLQAAGAPAAACWMIGNSPRSDINPALEAGMNAVFIPHPHTWVLEQEELRRTCHPGCRCLVLERLGDLQNFF